MKTDLYYIGKSIKKIYDLPDGEQWRGIVQLGICYLYDRSGKIIFRFDTDITTPAKKPSKILEVIVKRDTNRVTLKIYLE